MLPSTYEDKKWEHFDAMSSPYSLSKLNVTTVLIRKSKRVSIKNSSTVVLFRRWH